MTFYIENLKETNNSIMAGEGSFPGKKTGLNSTGITESNQYAKVSVPIIKPPVFGEPGRILRLTYGFT
jgi:hypothetical protein